MRRVHVVVRGRVQGVFFRAACAARARDSEVAGWVRNTDDGGVEAEFEGTAAAVEGLVAWCRLGPPHARVEAVEIRIVAPSGTPGFQIRS